MTAQELIERLDGVKRTGDGRWIARCPAHEDRSPSLTVREMGDGRVLVHCFAGCGAGDVVAAVGLRLSDLFPEGPVYHKARGVVRDTEARAYHESVVEIAAADLARGLRLSAQDIATLRKSREWLARNPRTRDWQ